MNKFNQYVDSLLTEEDSAWDSFLNTVKGVSSAVQTGLVATTGDPTFLRWARGLDYNNVYTLYPAGKSEKVVSAFEARVDRLKNQSNLFVPEPDPNIKRLTPEQFSDVIELFKEARRTNIAIKIQDIINKIVGEDKSLKASEEVEQMIQQLLKKDLEKHIKRTLSDDEFQRNFWMPFKTKSKNWKTKDVTLGMLLKRAKVDIRLLARVERNLDYSYENYREIAQNKKRSRATQYTAEQTKNLHNALYTLLAKDVYYLTPDQYEKLKKGKIDAWGRIIATPIAAAAKGIAGVAKGIGSGLYNAAKTDSKIGVRQGP